MPWLYWNLVCCSFANSFFAVLIGLNAVLKSGRSARAVRFFSPQKLTRTGVLLASGFGAVSLRGLGLWLALAGWKALTLGLNSIAAALNRVDTLDVGLARPF